MGKFKGFPEGLTSLVRIPEQFLTDVITQFKSLDELRVALFIFWQMERIEGPIHFLSQKSVINDPYFTRFYPELAPQEVSKLVEKALDAIIDKGFLLKASYMSETYQYVLIFLNSPKGRAAVKAINKGEWTPSKPLDFPMDWSTSNVSIFNLYEENVGTITPLIADAIKDAESTYPETWIREAIQIAVERNKRNWKYIQGILIRWEKNGRSRQQSSEDAQKDRKKYIEGEFAEYIEH